MENIINQSPFALVLVFLVIGFVFLIKGADFFVEGSSSIARKLKVPSIIIGLTIVAMGTSLPETAVSVTASLAHNNELAVSNVVGSNICNIALILGLCAVITPLRVNTHLFQFDAPVMLLAAAMLTIFYLTGHGISRIHGAIFFAAIILYTAWSVRQAKREAAVNAAVVEEARKSVSSGNAKAMRLPAAVLLTIAGLALLILGAKLFLAGSVFFARLLQVSDAVIGLTLVAVGTSLPELATSVVAAVRGEKDIAIGNVVGSNIFNVFAILGIAPLISPLRNATLSYVDLGVMLLCSVLLLPIMRTGWKISRLEGVFLLLIYIAYTAWLIMQSAL